MTDPKGNITKFDRKAAREFNDEVESLLAYLAKQFNLTLQRGNGRFGADQLTVKYTFNVKATDGTGAPADFAVKALRIGLPADCFGKEFTTFDGKRYKIVGLNLRAKKYPVQCEYLKTGKRYKLGAAAVQYGLKKAAA